MNSEARIIRATKRLELRVADDCPDPDDALYTTYLQARVETFEAAILDLECQGEWCGKSPSKHDNGLCNVCKLKDEIRGT